MKQWTLRILRSIANWLNPVVGALPFTEPEPSKPEGLYRCDNPHCCVWLPYGLTACPRCGQRQQRVRAAAVEQAILDALDPDNPYDWMVHGI